MKKSTRSAHVVVIGGGVAGISACCTLADTGCRVTLIERRDRLGGRATSIDEPASPDGLIDNCQHVLLGCCNTLLDLYRRLGVENQIEFFDRLQFIDSKSTRRGSLYALPLPAPLHLGFAMAGFPLLSLREKVQIGRAMVALIHMDNATAASLDAISFGQWLARQGQSPQTIARFWDVIITSALNESALQCSARYAVQVFRTGFLGTRNGWKMGISRIPLSRLYATVPATVLPGKRVTAISPAMGTGQDKAQSFVQLSDGQSIACDSIILAVAPDAARTLLSSHSWAEPIVASINQLSFRPIMGAHYFFDRPIMYGPHLALVGGKMDWLFRKDADGRHIQAVISNAGRWANLSPQAILDLLEKEIRRLLPWARPAKRLHARLIREQRATFSPLPGLDAHRLPQTTASTGLFIAGDYTQTDWPATMEGAAISGRRAAEALIHSIG